MSNRFSIKSFLKDREALIRIGVFAAFAVLIAFILPKHFFLDLTFELNKPWTKPDLKAPYEFAKLKPQNVIEAEEEKALLAVRPVFELDSTAYFTSTKSIIARLESLEEEMLLYQEAEKETEEQYRADILKNYDFDPKPVVAEVGFIPRWIKEVETEAIFLVDEIYDYGYVEFVPRQISGEIVALRAATNLEYLMPRSKLKNQNDLGEFIDQSIPSSPRYERNIILKILAEELQPNYSYSDSLTNVEITQAKKSISPVFGKVEKGEVIIRKDQPVGEEEAILLTSFMQARDQKFKSTNFFRTFGGQLIIVVLVTLLIGVSIRNYWPRIYFNNRKLFLVLLLFFVNMGFVVLVLRLGLAIRDVFDISSIYLVPFCMVPILLSNFFEHRFAYFCNIFLAVMVGVVVPNGLEYLIVQVAAGTVAVFSLRTLRKRADFFLPLIYIFLTYCLTYIGYNFYIREDLVNIQYSNLLLFAFSTVFTFIAYPLIYAIEKLFKITSDLTFMELLDTNHPLLKEMQTKAPGTFQHSLQVANIAEAVVNRIGGNGLLMKVGALFHDIGKMNAPEYFIENLKGEISPHTHLSFEESAKVIIKHVEDGVQMARKANLPDEIIHFIETHHGTSRTEYFYRMSLKEKSEEEVDEADFRYPGPIPFSKETAVLMIADSCEAACRSLKNPGPPEIENLVEKIVSSKVDQEQLENANITFKDILNIKKVVYDQLVNIYHGRIEYPEEAKKGKKDGPKVA